METIDVDAPGSVQLMMGNEAIVRGALEGGVGFAAQYPGTPSSEVLAVTASVAKRMGIHAEWSVNEMVAVEAAAAASFAGIPALSAMKQNGVNVCSDFLVNLGMTGIGEGGLVLVSGDDPSAISSSNEEDCSWIFKCMDMPLLEPATAQKAKDMTREENSNTVLSGRQLGWPTRGGRWCSASSRRRGGRHTSPMYGT